MDSARRIVDLNNWIDSSPANAATALCAVEHLDGGQGTSIAALHYHIEATHRRAGLEIE